MATNDGHPTHAQLLAWSGRLRADTARVARQVADVTAAARETLAASADLIASCRQSAIVPPDDRGARVTVARLLFNDSTHLPRCPAQSEPATVRA